MMNEKCLNVTKIVAQSLNLIPLNVIRSNATPVMLTENLRLPKWLAKFASIVGRVINGWNTISLDHWEKNNKNLAKKEVTTAVRGPV